MKWLAGFTIFGVFTGSKDLYYGSVTVLMFAAFGSFTVSISALFCARVFVDFPQDKKVIFWSALITGTTAFLFGFGFLLGAFYVLITSINDSAVLTGACGSNDTSLSKDCISQELPLSVLIVSLVFAALFFVLSWLTKDQIKS